MSEELELKLLREIEELKSELKILKGESKERSNIYSYSKIRDSDLEKLFDISQKLDKSKFDKWFNSVLELDSETIAFLTKLIKEEENYLNIYNEEDLKMRFLSPILREVDFKSENFRDFYNEKLIYENEKFSLVGEVDFLVSKGLRKAKKPYFFIQEFKRSEEYSNPRPQLLAEMIVGLELNNWSEIKGAYIVGSIWNFVILEKIEDKYIYYISANFDSSKIDDLIGIYKNLMFVKEEILALD